MNRADLALFFTPTVFRIKSGGKHLERDKGGKLNQTRGGGDINRRERGEGDITGGEGGRWINENKLSFYLSECWSLKCVPMSKRSDIQNVLEFIVFLHTKIFSQSLVKIFFHGLIDNFFIYLKFIKYLADIKTKYILIRTPSPPLLVPHLSGCVFM